MKFRSKQQKPPVGMEMTVTLSVSADATLEENRAALLKFFEAVSAASHDIGAAWIKIHCAGIPEDLEAALEAALAKTRNPAGLKLVVNNSGQADGQSGDRKDA